MDTKIRLGLIGCGSMMKTHAMGVNAISDELEITAVCDAVLERAEDMASVLNDPYVTTDYKTMVDHVDAVLIALPHDLHYECGVFFARQKKHILMEKPLCNSEEECLSLISMCEEENVVLMCAYPVRFFPGIRKLKELVDSGEYGKVMQMSIWTEQLTTADELDWKASARLGGGQFFSHGCHYVDILLWFLGNPIKGCHLGTRVGTPWLLGEGTSTAMIKFENGAIGYHGATWGARGSRLRVDYQIQTEKGMLEYHRLSDTIRLYDSHKEHVPGAIEEPYTSYKVIWEGEKQSKIEGELPGKHTQFEILHFIDCVKTGKKPITDGRTTLQGLRVIWAMYDAEKHDVMADLRGLGLEQVENN